MVEGGSEDEFGGHDDEGKGGEEDEDDEGGGGDEDDRGSEGGQGGQGGDTMAAQDVINMPPLHVMAVPIIGAEGPNDASELQDFFNSIPDEEEREMIHGDVNDALFLNLLMS